jgi:tRNA-modifying protein YgfZ
MATYRTRCSRVVSAVEESGSREGAARRPLYTWIVAASIAMRPRAFVRVAGPDAADYLERMLSNEVVALAVGDSREALLLTPKARVIAPMRVVRRGPEDFLLVTEPELGQALRDELVRMRFAAKAAIEIEEHRSYLLVGAENGGIPNADYGVPAADVLDQEPPADLPHLGEEELEALRIEAGTPRFGSEIDDRVLPAEAGLVERAVSLSKGCFPGQEPIARLHYRGHANRRLRVLEVDAAEPGLELTWDGKVVGRITSAVPGLALGYVRTEVPDDAELEVSNGQRVKMRPA